MGRLRPIPRRTLKPAELVTSTLSGAERPSREPALICILHAYMFVPEWVWESENNAPGLDLCPVQVRLQRDKCVQTVADCGRPVTLTSWSHVLLILAVHNSHAIWSREPRATRAHSCQWFTLRRGWHSQCPHLVTLVLSCTSTPCRMLTTEQLLKGQAH